MLTRKTVALSVLLTACVGCQGKAPPENIDAMWSDLSSEERVAHLEAELDDARDAMRGAANLEEWDGAYQDAQSALSLLRPEMWGEDREGYLEREAELDALAQTTHDAL